MDALVVKLDGVLKEQIDGYSELLEALEAEKNAITTLKSDAVQCIAGKKESILVNLQKLEDRRREIVRDLSAGMELSAEQVTLANFIKRLSAPQSRSLHQRRQTLLQLIRKVKTSNRQNSVLYQHSLAFVRHALGILQQADGTPEYYSNGQMRKSQGGGRVVCSDV